MVKINNEALIDFIWMSSRYCIGRSSIAACYHPNTIAEILLKNPKCISPERLEFFAYDIRSEIMEQLRWRDCIKEEGYNRDWDAYTECLCKEEGTVNKVFHIDNNTKEIKVSENPEMRHRIDNNYTDLIPWVKLANWLDKKNHKIVTVEYEENGEIITSEKECYHFPAKIEGEYVKVWQSVDMFSINQMYIIPEYIKDIK